MTRRIPQDPDYRTPCPAAIKAKITTLENAALEYARVGEDVLDPERRRLSDAQTARYNLEETVLTLLEATFRDGKRTQEVHDIQRPGHVSEVQGAITLALAALGKAAQPGDVAKAIMAGRIPHVKVEM